MYRSFTTFLVTACALFLIVSSHLALAQDLIQGKPISKPIKDLDDPNPATRRDAAIALSKAPEVAAVPKLTACLKDADAEVRSAAALALGEIGRFGESAAGALPNLTELLKDDKEASVRTSAAIALGRIGAKAMPALPVLLKAAEPPEADDIRPQAVEAIGFLYEKSPAEVEKTALPTLLRLIREDTNWRVRLRAVLALGMSMDLEKSGAVPDLEKVLGETDVESKLVRYEAAVLLGVRLGPKASNKTLDVLLANLNDRDHKIHRKPVKFSNPSLREYDARFLPAVALEKIGPKANRPDIIAALKETAQTTFDPETKRWAEGALKKIQGGR